MKVWTCNTFQGVFPVGTAAVIVAHTQEEAIQLLEEQLTELGLPQKLTPEHLVRLATASPQVRILRDGNY